MTKKRVKRIEPKHKLKEYLDSKSDSKIDLYKSSGIKAPDITKLKNFSTILSAERLTLLTKVFSDDLEFVIDAVFPDLQLPNKPEKDFKKERTILENTLFPLPQDYMSLEEMSYLTDIDIDRLKEIIDKPTVVISASELILLEKVKKLSKGRLFKLKFGKMKVKIVLK